MEALTEEYLRSTSVLAQKIGKDLDAAREAYQDLWNTLNQQEQEQVLDEAIIDPAVVLKYNSIKNKRGLDEYYNMSVDNQFSWFTKSQLNLFTEDTLKFSKIPLKKIDTLSSNNNLCQNPLIVGNKTKETNFLNKIKNKVTNLKIPSTIEEKQSLMESKSQGYVGKALLSKPKTPPPPPPSKQVVMEKKALLSVDNESDPDEVAESKTPPAFPFNKQMFLDKTALLSVDNESVPKTGFDFLDNW